MSTAQKKTPPQNADCEQGTPSGVVCNNPMSSVLVVFGIGIGAGVALGCLLSGPLTSRPSLGRRTGQAAEKLGRQMLDAIAGVLPDSMAKHITD